MRYAKGHGTGNDFVILPDVDDRLDLRPKLVRELSDRRTGIGADGVLRVVRARAGGAVAHGDDALFRVQMGPVRAGAASWAIIGGQSCEGLAIDVGNPHLACVIDEPVAGFDLSRPPGVDPAAFPDGANVEVVRLAGERAIEMRVYERGSGQTLSCGTGAVAAVAAAMSATGQWPDEPDNAAGGSGPSGSGVPPDGAVPSRVDTAVPWTVDVPGGRLTVVADPVASSLTGPAVIVAEGTITDSWLVTA